MAKAAKFSQINCIPANIAYYLTLRNATQNDLAAAMHMTPPTLSKKLRADVGSLTLLQMYRAAQYLRVDLISLMETEEMRKSHG